MGLLFRWRPRIAPGVRVNVTKRGPRSLSVGGRGATLNAGGRRGGRATFGLPGTGLSYQTRLSGGRRGASAEARGGRLAGWLFVAALAALVYMIW